MAVNILDLGSCWARLLSVFGIDNYDDACDAKKLRSYYETAAKKLQTMKGSPVWPSWADRCAVFGAKVDTDSFYSALGRMYDIDENSSVIALFQHKALDRKKSGFVSAKAISGACYDKIVDQLGIRASDGFDMEILLQKSGLTQNASDLYDAIAKQLPYDPLPVTGDAETGFVTEVPGNVEMCDRIEHGKGFGIWYHLDGTKLCLDKFVGDDPEDESWSEVASFIEENNCVTQRSDRNLVVCYDPEHDGVNFYSTFDLICMFGLVGVVIVPYFEPSDDDPEGQQGILGFYGGVDIKTWLACNSIKQHYDSANAKG